MQSERKMDPLLLSILIIALLDFHLPNTSTTSSLPVAVSFSKNLDTMSITYNWHEVVNYQL